MQPYQRAAESTREKSEFPIRALKKGASLGLGAASLYGGGSILARLKPLLSEYIPADLAIKGLSKINPKFGEFIDKSLKNGISFDQIKEFISEKIGSAEEGLAEKKQADQKNIIQQYSPELHSFITEEIGKGRQPLEAGALAQLSGKFKKAIKKMEEDHKTQFSSILQSTYGAGESKGMSKEEATKRFLSRKKSNLPNELIQQFEGQYGPMSQQGQQSQQGQSGPGQQAIMSVMQKILQNMGQ